jgi:hypothetical protein
MIMRAFVFLALAAIAVAACTIQSKTVERPTPDGRTTTSDSLSVGTTVTHD